MKKYILSLVFLLFVTVISAQNILKGTIKAPTNNKELSVIPGVTLTWLNTNIGTTTDENGNFTLPESEKTKDLLVNAVGYMTDTIHISEFTFQEITLEKELEIESVVIDKKQEGSHTTNADVYTKTVTTAGLKQLPCCNLSESFENSADVDVTYTDAVSGAKQIQMLGLSGIYSQLLVENMPAMRGVAVNYGMYFIPGPWLESIQISKGTSAVINGYESITGQINIELQKAHRSDKFYVNLFGNQEGRAELNTYSAIKLNHDLSTIFMVHASTVPFVIDHNHDHFADQPLTNQINVANRWFYMNEKGIESQIGFNAIYENRTGGQLHFLETDNKTDYYGIGVNTNRFEIFYKLGAPITFMHEASVGSTFSLNYHKQKSFFGKNSYNVLEKSFYGNIIFDKEIINHKNTLNFGTSLLVDDYNEEFNDKLMKRVEVVPGVFIQHTFSVHEKFSSILGYRFDYHNLYGAIHTARLHLRYNIFNNTVLRASGGKGYRVANIYAENIGVMASSRSFVVDENLKMEEAWNFGTSLTHKIEISNYQSISFGVDYYRTDFVNQVVVDLDASTSQAHFYNLNGKSYSNSFQADLTIKPIRRMIITSAFRYNDVKITMHDQLIEKPLVSKYKGLVNISYTTIYNKWVFDVTNQFQGKAKLPNTSQNPDEYQLGEYSPAFYMLHAQITRNFKNLEFYVGCENITNFVQKNPIISADNPFGEFFDSSIIWGPIMGRSFYAGIRYKIK